jgi:phage terminase large subunit-like protein
LVVEQRKDADGMTKYQITSGKATWAGQSIQICQSQITTWGLTAFLQEAQHEVTEAPGGIYNHIEFAHCTLDECPDFVDGAVWVDPAITSKDSSDCQGIQMDAISEKGILYRLFSWEQIASPETALKKAILKAMDYGFVTVGVETDQGGDVWRPAYNKVCDQLILDTNYPSITKRTRFPEMQQAKAGSGHGSKVERSMRMLVSYEHGEIIHVIGTHDVLEKALRRFPNPPLDLADAAYWSWYRLQGGGSGWSMGMGS